jgi:DNA-binding MarR family transcriptional regulator
MSSNYDDPRITLAGLLDEVFTGLTGHLSAHIGEHGLSSVDFTVLLRLVRSPGRRLRMSDLAAQTSLSASGITRIVDRLEKGGLIVREHCPGDRRSLYAALTPAGVERMDEVLPGHVEDLQKWLVDPLTEEQYAGLLGALRVLRDSVNPGARSGTEA